MSKGTIVELENPSKAIVEDQLTEFMREAAQNMIKVAVQAEADAFIMQHKKLTLEDGKQRVVRNGYLPERAIQTGIGQVQVKIPRVRDRHAQAKEQGLHFSSTLVPKYLRRTMTLDVLLPLLYLKGISAGDMQSALVPLLGDNAKSLSANVISRLKTQWYDDYQHWLQRDLTDKQYVYWWADGIYLQARMESEKSCVLVIIGADETGKKELVALIDGFRESKESWLECLRHLRQRGLKHAPRLAIGDGALGFWGALNELFPKTKQQRCWVHKTVNVLDKLPTSQRSHAKTLIHDIYMADSLETAEKAWQHFVQTYQLKYAKAVTCLNKDKEQMLTFYDYPAEHWVHLRTTNPIESTFATVRHRTRKSKNCFSRHTIMASVFKLCCEAEKRWRYLNARKRVVQVIHFEKFINGIHVNEIVNNKLTNKDAA
jgi:transposase-like protein